AVPLTVQPPRGGQSRDTAPDDDDPALPLALRCGKGSAVAKQVAERAVRPDEIRRVALILPSEREPPQGQGERACDELPAIHNASADVPRPLLFEIAHENLG